VQLKVNTTSTFQLRAKHYLALTVGFILFYQVLLLYLWNTYVNYDTILLRYSLSNSDAMAISAYALSMFALWQYEKSSASMDTLQMFNIYLSEKMTKEEVKLYLDYIYENEIKPRIGRIRKMRERQEREKVANDTKQGQDN